MKKLLVFILFFVIVSGFIPVTSYGAGEERFVFTDLTATDKKTGLMWTKDANIAKKTLTWKKTFKFIEKLNKQKYAGYGDWRLPKIEELETLLDYAKKQGYKGYPLKMDCEGCPSELFNKIGFKNVQAWRYWSSTEWVVGMASGDVFGLGTGDMADSCVWPVRGGK